MQQVVVVVVVPTSSRTLRFCQLQSCIRLKGLPTPTEKLWCWEPAMLRPVQQGVYHLEQKLTTGAKALVTQLWWPQQATGILWIFPWRPFRQFQLLRYLLIKIREVPVEAHPKFSPVEPPLH